MDLDTFETAAVWTLTGLLAVSGTPLAAIAFFTVAPSFVVAMRTGNLGGIITWFIDGDPVATVDTYSASPGIAQVTILGDPELEGHQIYAVKDDDPDTIAEIVRKELSPDEVTPPDTRWNEECNCVQTTVDGGTTWVQNDGADPRKNPAYLMPALSGEDARCDAATGMSARIKTIVDAFLNTATLTGTATAIFGVISILFPPAAIVAAVLAIAGFFIAIGELEVTALMTEEVYAQLICIFYCRCDENGQLTDEAFAQVYTDIEAQLPEGAAGIAERCLDLIGMVGINNAGALATETGDCSECPDCAEPPELQIQIIGGTPYGEDLVMIDVGIWQCTSHDFSDTNHWVLLETVDADRKFQVTAIELISGGGGAPWYRSFPSRATDEYAQADPTDVPNINGVGQSRPDTGAFTIQYTIINS